MYPTLILILAFLTAPLPSHAQTSPIRKWSQDLGTMISWMLGGDQGPAPQDPDESPPAPKVPKPDLSTPEKIYAFQQAIIFDGRVKDAFHIDEKGAFHTNLDQFMQMYRDKKLQPENFPWLVSQFPSLEVRRDFFYNRTLKMGHGMLGSPVLNYDNSMVQLHDREVIVDFMLNRDRKYAFHFFGSAKPAPLPTPPNKLTFSYFSETTSNPSLQWLACIRLAKVDAKKCMEALKGIIDFMAPSDVFTALPAVNEVLNNPDYADGAARAAIKIIKKVDSISDLNIAYDNFGDLFTDLYESYVESGIPPARAQDMTWNLLMVYASRGANTHLLDPFVGNLAAARTMTALKVIAMGLSVLDAASHKSGQLYSLPKGIRSTANYGKVYHFWMPAALARMMAQKYGNAFASTMAAVLVEIGYQMFSNTSGRDRLLLNTLTESPYGMTSNKVRMDLGFGFAGAVFGGSFQQERSTQLRIDLDQVMRVAIDKARDYRSLDPEEATNLLIKIQTTGGIQRDWTLTRAFVRYAQFVRPLGILSEVKKQAACNWTWTRRQPPLISKLSDS